jgi:CDP-diglyceride synthetase
MKKVNIYLIVTAVLLILLGVVCIFNPGAGFASAAWLMGLLILCSGISSLIFGLRAQAFLPNAGSTTLLALFQIVVGLMLATNILASQVALIAVFATVGDLVESVAKRETGIKDSGNIIPGHGGVWDRFDSVLFTAPLVYYFTMAYYLLTH